MLKTERQRKILDLITQRKHCTVKFLAETLFVSPITVRRDLDTLEGEGLVTRCYGGVSVPRHLNREVPLEVRENSNTGVKGALARRAAMRGADVTLVCDGTAYRGFCLSGAEPDLYNKQHPRADSAQGQTYTLLFDRRHAS